MLWLLLLPCPAQAQGALSLAANEHTSAGVALAPDTQTFWVHAWRFTGDLDGLDTAALSRHLGPLPRRLDLAALQQLIDQLSQALRSEGRVLASASLPEQDIIDGVVEVAVMQGRLARVELLNSSAVQDGVLARLLEGLPLQGVLQRLELTRSLMLLQELPGTRTQASLRSGALPGTTELLVSVQDGERFAASATLDNFGNRPSGVARLGLHVRHHSPLGRGDVLSWQLQVSQGSRFAHLSWTTPAGGDGLRLGVSASRMTYRLGAAFEALGVAGSANTLELSAVHPLVRTEQASVDVKLGWSLRSLRDGIELTQSLSQREHRVTQVSLSGSRVDDWQGVNTASLAWSLGRLRLDADSLEVDQMPGGNRSAGRYQKWQVALQRTQWLPGQWSLSVSASAQVASKNLASSEKMSLGGPRAVRAYPAGEASGDEGWLSALELSHTFAFMPRLSAQAFFDQGRSWDQRVASPGQSRGMRSLSGLGLGLRWQFEGGSSLHMTVAQPGSSDRSRTDTDRLPRVWLELNSRF